MKKVIAIIILCLCCLSGFQAQNYWKSIGMQGIFLGVGPDGGCFSYYGTSPSPSITRSQDEGHTWEVVLGYATGFDTYFNWHCFSVSPEGRIFVCEDYPYRVFYSDDNGDTWQTTAPVPLIYPSTAKHLFALNNDIIVGVDDNDYTFWTTDGGASWDTVILDFMYMDNGPAIEDLLVNNNGDVYLGVSTLGGGGGIYHATISDMQHWQVAVPDCSIVDMAFDPEGNVVACGWNSYENIGFQHTPGFYVFEGRHLAVSNSGIVYTTHVTEDNTAVLAYSLDHGETFVEIGEGLSLDPPLPDYQDGSFYYGYDNCLYFEGRGYYWKSMCNADEILDYNPWIGVGFFDEASGLNYVITGNNTVEVTYDEMFVSTGYNNYEGDIVIPETVTYDGVSYIVTAVGERAFENCIGQLTSVVVPNTVTSVGNKAFANCSSLTSAQLPEGITILPTELFVNCWALASFVIPSTVTHIEPRAFAGTGLISIDIPESVTSLGEGAFSFSGLVAMDLPNTVTELGPGVFIGCRELRSIRLNENLKAIPARFLSQCSRLVSVSIPESVTEIGESAFSYCEGLTTVNIPGTAHCLGEGLFLECHQLRNVALPEGIDTIPQQLFAGCTRLDSIMIPESVVWISPRAFSGCNALEEVVIPKNVRFIGYEAFANCNHLSIVELGASVSYLEEKAFNRSNEGSVKLTLVCHGITPAQCDTTTFPQKTLQKMAIVPCGCEDHYRDAWADCWQSGNFEEDCSSEGAEWYYEILNDDGSITYQYLRQSGDTVVQDEPTHILVRINTLYDKGVHVDISHEYIYERDSVVYWWNKTLGEFTVLYDFGAETGDEWEIKVGDESLIMHVDAVKQYEYEGRTFKMLQVSDAENQFGGTIIRGIGHLTSFFPERLMNAQKGFRVEGIRCFWKEGQLMFKYGERDCDEVHEEFHGYGVDEPVAEAGFQVYPNPTDGLLYVATQCMASLPWEPQEYCIINLMGQTLMTGHIEGESQQIDVSVLPQGMYFIRIGNAVQKLIIK